jgi:hypothetical protein
VAKALHRREPKVPIAHVGNTGKTMRGASVVRYSEALQVEGWQVAAAVFPTADVMRVPAGHVVELDIASGFRRMATSAEYRAAYDRLAAAGSPTPSPSLSPCAPQSPAS